MRTLKRAQAGKQRGGAVVCATRRSKSRESRLCVTNKQKRTAASAEEARSGQALHFTMPARCKRMSAPAHQAEGACAAALSLPRPPGRQKAPPKFFPLSKMAATPISKKRKFVADGVFYAELNELLMRELVRRARRRSHRLRCRCVASCGACGAALPRSS